MKVIKTRLWAIAVISLSVFQFIPEILIAQENKPDIQLKISVQKEISVIEDGKISTKLVTADETERGDVLVYRIVYSNDGNAIAVNPAIVDAIPEDTVYIIGSAAGDKTSITYSINGGKTYGSPPVKYIVKTAAGTEKEVDAPANLYTHIKWLINEALEPGQSGELSFKVNVD